MTQKTFDESTLGSGIYRNYYAWSVAGNWTPSGEPADGDDLAYTAESASDQQVDDIASLDANSLTLAATASDYETLYVAGDLTIGTLTLDSVGPKIATLEATDTFDTNPTVTIDGFGAGSAGTLLAYGPGAVIDVDASDPGAMTYESADGALVELSGAPAATSTLDFYDDAGILALAAPGHTIAAALTGVQAGDAIELPGSEVKSVLYGGDTITIATDAGTYTFDNVAYSGGALTSATGFYGVADAASGLEGVTFSTAVFSMNDAAATGPFTGDYLWSEAGGWNGSLTPNSGTVELVSPVDANGFFVIDEPDLSLTSFTVEDPSGHGVLTNILVNGDVTIENLTMSNTEQISADTTISGGAISSTLTILNSLTVTQEPVSGDPHFTANGSGATLNLDVPDPGNAFFKAENGGVLTFNSSPNAGSELIVDGKSEIEFVALGATVSDEVLVTGEGATIELPGESLVSASLTAVANSDQYTLSIVTTAGTYSLTGIVTSSSVPLWGLAVSHDATTGLEKITFEENADALVVTASGSGITNGSGKIGVGGKVTFTVDMSSAVTIDTSSGTPRLALSDGGFAAYSGGSGTNLLTFVYTVGAGQNTSDLSVVAYDPEGATILDRGNDAAIMSGVVGNPRGTLRVATNPNQFADDFNDDKTSDVLWTAVSGGAIVDWSIVGGAKTKSLALGTTHAGDKLVGTGDFNGDGTTDLLFRNATSGEVDEMDVSKGNAGKTHNLVTEAPSTDWAVAATGDFNGDGTSDILWRNSASGKVMISMVRNDALFKSATMFGPASGYAFLAAGDLNGDGTTDIVWENRKSHALLDWRMTGGDKHTSIAMGTSPTGETYVGIGHFRGKASDELLFESSTGALSAWVASAGKMVDKLNLDDPALPNNFAVAAIGDYNGDGRSDVMLYDKSDGQIDVGLLGGSGHIAAWAKVGTLSPTNWGFAG